MSRVDQTMPVLGHTVLRVLVSLSSWPFRLTDLLPGCLLFMKKLRLRCSIQRGLIMISHADSGITVFGHFNICIWPRCRVFRVKKVSGNGDWLLWEWTWRRSTRGKFCRAWASADQQQTEKEPVRVRTLNVMNIMRSRRSGSLIMLRPIGC